MKIGADRFVGLFVVVALFGLLCAAGFSCGDDDDDDVAGDSPETCDTLCAKAVQCDTPCIQDDCPTFCYEQLSLADLECAQLSACDKFNACLCGVGDDDDDDDDNDTVDDDDDDDDDNDDDSDVSVTIINPITGDVFGLTQTVALIGEALDSHYSPLVLDIEWKSSIDGVLDTTAPDANGIVRADVSSLSEGAHTITLTATNPDQVSGSDQISIDILDYWFALEPVCALVETGDTIQFTVNGAVAPVAWVLAENNSGATIDPSTGLYTAGATAWTNDHVVATDANNVWATRAVIVLGTWAGSRLNMISGDPYSNSRSYRVSSRDYDFDGDLDFIVANIGSGYDRIFVNSGVSTFTVFEPFPLYASREVKFIDYDGDHDCDVAFGGSDNSGSHLYENKNNVFVEVFNWGSSQEDCLGMAVGDLTGDGFPEIVCAHNQDTHPTDMTILINTPLRTGGRTFSQIYFGPTQMTSQALSLADVDGDFDLDLAVGGSKLTASSTPVANLLCLNDGSANLTCTNEFGSGITNEIAFGDFDGDHDPDLLVSNSGEPLAIWWNSGDADPIFTQDNTVFDPQVNMGGVRQFGLGDVEGMGGGIDGDIDVVVTQGGASASAILYLSMGDGTFCPHTIFDGNDSLSTKGVQASHMVNLNGTGWLDLVVTRYRDYNEVWITE